MTPSELGHQTPSSEYDFDLPKNLIAQEPTRNREDARLLVVDRQRGTIEHAHFRDLTDWLRPGDGLVLNETKVLMAKLVGYRTKTKGRWHGLFLEQDPGSGVIKVMCKTRGKIEVGETVTLQDRDGMDRDVVKLVSKLGGGCWAIQPVENEPAEQWLQRLGRVPLPHYIRDGNMTDSDVTDYQTIFAKNNGSVAAPTAGLHFSDRLLNRVIDRGVDVCKLTLHVGTGTFRPISTETIEEHAMHGESGEIDQSAMDLLKQTRERGGRVIAVGTTSTRLLETAGARPDPYQAWAGTTDLYIRPGHKFNFVGRHHYELSFTANHVARTSANIRWR